MRRKHNRKSFILCLVLIGTLCASLQASVIPAEAFGGLLLSVAEDVVSLPANTTNTIDSMSVEKEEGGSEATVVPLETNVKDEATTEEAADSESRESADQKADDNKAGVSVGGGVESTQTEAEKKSDDKIATTKEGKAKLEIGADLEIPEENTAAPKRRIAANTISIKAITNSYVVSGTGYSITIPKEISFSADESSASDGVAYYTNNEAYDFSVKTEFTKTGSAATLAVSEFEMKNQNGSGSASHTVKPYLFYRNLEGTLPENIIVSTKSNNGEYSNAGVSNIGDTMVIKGESSFDGGIKLIPKSGERIGAGHWSGKMTFTVTVENAEEE